jgi:hypothetical protein
VSHAPERKEKVCLNCGTVIYGRFCHVCGQENVVPKESFGNLIIHFFYDITHFDSKFFETVKDLFFKPGFLSKEYTRGRRAGYLNPIRMYIFTSAFFFLIFFSFFNPADPIRITTGVLLTEAERKREIVDLENELKDNPSDSILKKQQIALLSDTNRQVTINDLMAIDTSFEFNFFYKINHNTIREYDSAQQLLPSSARDGWFKKRIIRKGILVANDVRTNQQATLKQWGDDFLHKLPYLLFVSLPGFALILKLLYVRRKQFFYADHIIFAIHHYIFSFWLLLFFFGLSELRTVTNWGFLNFLIAVVFILWPVYLLIAMKKFYGQRWFKTFLKFIILNLLGILMLVLLFVIFFIIILL